MSNPDEPGAGPPMTNSTASALKYLAEFIEYQPGTTMAPQREKAESCLGVLRAALGARPAQPPEPSEEVLTAAHLRDAAEIVEWYAEATDDNIQSVGATLLADRLRRAVLRAGVPAHPEQDEKLVMTEFGLMPTAVLVRAAQPPDEPETGWAIGEPLTHRQFAWVRWAREALRAGVPAPPDVEALLEEIYGHLREPCTLDGAREARAVVAANLIVLKKEKYGAGVRPEGALG